MKGIISPGIYEGKKKTGIEAVNLSDGEKRKLADFCPGWDPEKPSREWKFFEDALEWGNNVISRSTPADVLIFDELGFMEFEKGLGWTSAFKVIEQNEFAKGFIVVRNVLLNNALAEFGECKVINLKGSRSTDHSVQGAFQDIVANWEAT